MRRHAVLAGLAVSLAPLSTLAGLVGLGLLAPPPALVAAALILACGWGLTLVWLIDLDRLDGARLWPNRALAATLRARRRADLLEQARRDDASRSDRAILERMPDPLLVLAEDRSVTYANRAARETLGTETSAVLRHPTLRGAIDRAQTPGQTSQTVELLLPVPVPRDLHATVLNLADIGPRTRTALVLADRTQARAVERMRADFVANASHELRTPLASLIGFIDTLRGPAIDDVPAQQRFLGIMAEQAARMNRLIDDLLSLSRIELSEHLAPSQRVDLAALIGRTLSSFEPRCTQVGATVARAVQQGLPPVLADEDQIEQVLQNLLDNALKYGREESTIHVGLQAAAGANWPGRAGLVLSVRDEGQGIPRTHLPRLTERFYRVDRGRSRAAGGTGLGLAIVKHIVNRHRGQLTIDSEEGVGSTFSVWLPLAG
jgi:two-component system phosphate regulon sensor histidine kinase PhoR